MQRVWVLVEGKECPLNTLATYDEEELAGVRVMFDQSCIDQLRTTADDFVEEQGLILAIWERPDGTPETVALFKSMSEGYELILAEASDIAFKQRVEIPNRVLMFTMEE